MLKHTKIIATISDLRCEVEFIRSLYRAGMNVVRLNTAHMSQEGMSRVVNHTRAVSGRIGILIDTKGPEIRTTPVDAPVAFKTGERVKIAGNPEEKTTHDCIHVSYQTIADDLNTGNDLMIDDGDLELKVVEKQPGYLVCEVLNDAVLGSRKSVNVP
ncbi:MAG: pyruvate kinase, partial [Tannerella sp.]|nr:pyruvate kinase [Tannerella sp.]